MEYPNVDLNKVERAFSVFVNEYRCGHIKPSYFLINTAYTGLYYMISYDFSFAAVNNGKLSFAKVDMNEASQFLGPSSIGRIPSMKHSAPIQTCSLQTSRLISSRMR